jgi:lysozyme family protein
VRVDSIIDDIIRREGKTFTDRPSDRGGPTKFGITQATLEGYRKRPCSRQDVVDLTETEARKIYEDIYCRPFEFVRDFDLRVLMIDSAVQHGMENAVRFLQVAVGAKPDGILGPETRKKTESTIPVYAYRRALAERVRFYGKIITNDAKRRKRTEDQALNAHGWMNRVAEFIVP